MADNRNYAQIERITIVLAVYENVAFVYCFVVNMCVVPKTIQSVSPVSFFEILICAQLLNSHSHTAIFQRERKQFSSLRSIHNFSVLFRFSNFLKKIWFSLWENGCCTPFEETGSNFKKSLSGKFAMCERQPHFMGEVYFYFLLNVEINHFREGAQVR